MGALQNKTVRKFILKNQKSDGTNFSVKTIFWTLKMPFGPFDDDSSLKAYKFRLATFKEWPFLDDEDSSCTPEKMAEAGFYLVGNANEPDLVRCYYCRRELDGWEPTHIPWDEHKRRNCPYISLGKTPQELTVEDAFNLEAERKCILLREAGKKVVEQYQAFAQEQKAKIEDLGAATQQKRGKRKKRN